MASVVLEGALCMKGYLLKVSHEELSLAIEIEEVGEKVLPWARCVSWIVFPCGGTYLASFDVIDMSASIPGQ